MWILWPWWRRPFPRISPVYYPRAVSYESVVRLDNSAPTMSAPLKRDFRLLTLHDAAACAYLYNQPRLHSVYVSFSLIQDFSHVPASWLLVLLAR